MFKKVYNSKRGEVVGDALDFLSILFTLLIVLVFLHLTFTSSASEKENLVSRYLTQSYAQQELLALLRSAVTVEGNELTLADFILMRHQQNDRYSTPFIAEVQRLLEQSAEKCASFAVESESSSGLQVVHPLVVSSGGRFCQPVQSYISASLTLPKEKIVITYRYPLRS